MKNKNDTELDIDEIMENHTVTDEDPDDELDEFTKDEFELWIKGLCDLSDN